MIAAAAPSNVDTKKIGIDRRGPTVHPNSPSPSATRPIASICIPASPDAESGRKWLRLAG